MDVDPTRAAVVQIWSKCMASEKKRIRKKKTIVPTPPPTFVLGKGGPSLVDLRIRRSEFRILVTGPGMLYEKLQLVTTLSISEGCHFRTMEKLAERLSAVALCGSAGSRPAEIRTVGRRTSPVIEIEPGPHSMYQNELVIQTRNGWSFDKLIRKTIAENSDDDDFIVALEALPASGHMEHHIPHDMFGSDPSHDGHGGHAGHHHG